MRNEDITIEIAKLDTKNAFEWLMMIDEVPANVMDAARWGFLDPPIDIMDYINSKLLKQSDITGDIDYKGYVFRAAEWNTDILKRTMIMKRWLKTYYDNDNYIKARQGKKNEKKEIV